MTDYTRCPCGAELAELQGGIYHRCPHADEYGMNTGGKFVTYLAAWVCGKGWAKVQAAKRAGHKEPNVNPDAVEAYRDFRATMRGNWR